MGWIWVSIDRLLEAFKEKAGTLSHQLHDGMADRAPHLGGAGFGRGGRLAHMESSIRRKPAGLTPTSFAIFSVWSLFIHLKS